MVRNFLKSSQKILERQNNSILSAASVITAAVMISSLLGFVRTRLLVSYFYERYTWLPAGADLDAYWVSFQIPDFVFQLLVIGALSAAFIPVFTKYLKNNTDEAYQVANSMINLVIILFLLVSGLIFLWAHPLVELLTGSGFSPERVDLAVKLMRFMLAAQVFFAVSSFITGILQSHQRFLIPALSPIAYNLGIIFGVVVLGPWFGIYGAAVGVVLGALVHLLVQLPLALRVGYRYRPVINWRHRGVREMITLTLPRTMALAVDQLESFLVTFLATTIPGAGVMVIVTLAQQLMKAPVRIFGVPIGQASLPFLSKDSAHNRKKEFQQTLTNSLLQIFYLVLPAAALLLVLRIPLVRILYGAKDFPWESTLATGRMVAILSVAVVAHSGIQLLNRAFYALHDTKLPFGAMTVSLIISSLFAWVSVLYWDWGVIGIAIGLSLGPVVQLLILLVAISRRIQGIIWTKFVLDLFKMILAAAAMAIFLWVPMRFLDHILDTTRTLNLVWLTIATTGVGGIIYLWLSQLLVIEQQQAVLRIFDKVGNWRQVLSDTEETIDSPTESQSL